MQKEIQTSSGTIPYTMKSVRWSKSVRVIVHGDGRVVLTKPLWVSMKKAEGFLRAKVEWLVDTLKKTKELYEHESKRAGNPEEYKRLRHEALQFVKQRVAHINEQFYRFEYNTVTVRNQKTRWGSCSKNGNLSFNYRILHLDPACADYLIAHELCHLKEFNHSDAFWSLVSHASPHYKTLRRQMKGM